MSARGFFQAIKKKKNLMINGDIGCYTLGANAPLNALDTAICMGASLSMAHGASQAYKMVGAETKAVGVLGDSTFFHSGITSIMDSIYNQGHSISVILDNRITGMTGHQQNPGSGFTLMGKEAPEVDIPALLKAIGMKEENIPLLTRTSWKRLIRHWMLASLPMNQA